MKTLIMDPEKISKLLISFQNGLKECETITVGEIVREFKDRSITFFTFLLALPAALPMPGLGINLVIALPLLFLSCQLIIAKDHLWLPHRFEKKALNANRLSGMLTIAIPWVQKMEWFLRPRLRFLTHRYIYPFVGIAALIMSISVCVPLPATNTVPCFGIAMMSLGLLTRDGFALMTGFCIGLGWVLGLVYFGFEMVDWLKSLATLRH